MLNKWIDVVREQYFKTHDYIFPDEPKLWNNEKNLSLRQIFDRIKKYKKLKLFLLKTQQNTIYCFFYLYT